jgi:predicted TIM-barrel fold metal-dependent hydrolase
MATKQSVGDNPERLMIISADGHAAAKMPDYRDYIEPAYLQEFDAYLADYSKTGTRSGDAASLRNRTDPEIVAHWEENIISKGRLDGAWDPYRRLTELEQEGAVAEIIYPDFGLPFETLTPFLAALAGRTLVESPAHATVAAEAHNRWMIDYVAAAPDRLIGIGRVEFYDIARACRELRHIRAAGLAAVVLPRLSDQRPLYHPDFNDIWNTLEELDMPLCIHPALSNSIPVYPVAPNPQSYSALNSCEIFFGCHKLLPVLIWGGVLERHPQLRVVFAEQHSGWVINTLAGLDHQWSNSYLGREIRELVPSPPSFYWERQCFLGASLLSRAEVAACHLIGIEKIMFGIDYPHHEGTWTYGTAEYIRQTLGAAGISQPDARLILGDNAAKFWDIDVQRLRPLIERVGPRSEEVLVAPDESGAPLRGDIHRPLATI